MGLGPISFLSWALPYQFDDRISCIFVLVSLVLGPGGGKWKVNTMHKKTIFFLSHFEWNPQLGVHVTAL